MKEALNLPKEVFIRKEGSVRYTFPRAMQALASDSYARAALASMACALAAGAAGGQNDTKQRLAPSHLFFPVSQTVIEQTKVHKMNSFPIKLPFWAAL